MTFNTGDKVKLVPFDVAQTRLPKFINQDKDFILGISRERYESYLDQELTIEADAMPITCRLVEDRLKFSWLVTCFDLANPEEEEKDEEEEEKQFETPVECMAWLIGEFDEIVDMIDPTDSSETYHKVRAALVRIMEEFEEEK